MSLGRGTLLNSRADVLRWLVPGLVTAGLLFAVSRAVDRAELVRHLGLVPGWTVLAAAALVPVQVGLAAIRWRATNAHLGLQLSSGEAFAETGLATLLNQLLPSGIAGEVVRVWRQRRPDRSTAQVVGAAVADRGLGLATFVVVLLVSLLLWPVIHSGIPPMVSLGAAGLLVVGGAGVMRVSEDWAWVGPSAQAAREAVLGERRGVLVLTSVGFLAAIFLQAAGCALALGLPVGFGFLTVLPWYLLSMLIPLSVGGWGPKEVAALGLFPLVGWGPEAATAFSTMFGLTTLVGSIPFALGGLVRRTPS
ncbi:MAG: lysylphosphatidylglycerol synthase transmembrane domain-containing protein [Myxococcota bacterium]